MEPGVNVPSQHVTPSPENPLPNGRPTPETLLGRAIRLRCPRCGEGKLYRRWFSMNERCPVCNFLISRKQGYYLGSIYMGYGAAAWITTILYIVCHFVLQIPAAKLIGPLAAFCVVFPTLYFRHARAFWLSLDCQLDPNVLIDDLPEIPHHPPEEMTEDAE